MKPYKTFFRLMIIALTNVCLLYYRFIIIWSIIMGSVSVCYSLGDNKKG